MKRFVFLLPGLLFFAALSSHSADGEDLHPIDRAMDEAIEQNPSTAGMVQAISEAGDKWEKEIAAALAELEKQMEPREWEALELSQRAWSVFRDLEIRAKEELYSRMEGTMWRPAAASSVMALTRSRALELRRYLDTLSER